MSDINPDTQETANKQGKCKSKQNKTNPTKTIRSHIILKLQKSRDKEKSPERTRGGGGKNLPTEE